MDAQFLFNVSQLEKLTDYLTRLKGARYFRRNQILIDKEKISSSINQLTTIMIWIRNFGTLFKEDAHIYSEQCDVLIEKFEKQFEKFERRIVAFDDDDIASDSFDDESACNTSSSER